jgi:hypothetical protein
MKPSPPPLFPFELIPGGIFKHLRGNDLLFGFTFPSSLLCIFICLGFFVVVVLLGGLFICGAGYQTHGLVLLRATHLMCHLVNPTNLFENIHGIERKSSCFKCILVPTKMTAVLTRSLVSIIPHKQFPKGII